MAAFNGLETAGSFENTVFMEVAFSAVTGHNCCMRNKRAKITLDKKVSHFCFAPSEILVSLSGRNCMHNLNADNLSLDLYTQCITWFELHKLYHKKKELSMIRHKL